jgi:hypothetical protein
VTFNACGTCLARAAHEHTFLDIMIATGVTRSQ